MQAEFLQNIREKISDEILNTSEFFDDKKLTKPITVKSNDESWKIKEISFTHHFSKNINLENSAGETTVAKFTISFYHDGSRIKKISFDKNANIFVDENKIIENIKNKFPQIYGYFRVHENGQIFPTSEDSFDHYENRGYELHPVVSYFEYKKLEERNIELERKIAHLEKNKYQQSVTQWLHDCFGKEVAENKIERIDRFMEEAFELAQALNYPKEFFQPLIDYTYKKPKGEPSQEVGGVRTTLAALCFAHNLDEKTAAYEELTRITDPKVMAKIREKQKNKPKNSPLPA